MAPTLLSPPRADVGGGGSGQTAAAPPRARSGWIWIALTSLAIAGFSAGQYAMGNLATLADAKVGLAANYAHRALPVQLAFYTHVIFGGTALLLGPWQFAARLRRRRPGLHHLIGRGYLVAVAVAGLAGLIIAPFNQAKLDGFFGFGILAVLWIFTATRAYQTARSHDFAAHQAWIIRNFALTYAAVTLRLWSVLLVLVQVPVLTEQFTPDVFARLFANGYWAVPFLCWVPNVVVAEWLVRRRGLPRI